MPKLFISYSHKDQGFVQKLAADLRYLGADLWIDFAEIKVGDSLIERIRQGIDGSEFVAVVLSQHSIDSNWVQREMDVAMNQEIIGKRIRVLPILLDDVELPGFLLGKYYADFRGDNQYLFSLGQLAFRLELDFDPLPLPSPPPSDYSRTYSHTTWSLKRRTELYNRLAMKILDWAMEFPAELDRSLFPEGWHRANDGATYAVDTGDYELYQYSMESMKMLEERYSHFSYLFSQQGILLRESFRLFREAATLGDPEAMWNLGWRYELGQGVRKDHSRAIAAWNRAAQYGHEDAKKKVEEEKKKGEM